MEDQLELNCLGMKCPRPIIEIAKAARKLSAGSVMTVHADDLAFESDVLAWSETTNAAILDLQRVNDRVSVTLQLS
jgi:TusA-related sulfurtransferase